MSSGSRNSPASRAKPYKAASSPELITYSQSESLCETLADRLVVHLGDELARADFVAIPRGGLIVLGQLSYLLDLSPAQLKSEPDGDLVVVVDDCALSGRRFAETLDGLSAQRIVFAHLVSPAALRREILRQEGHRVSGCLAALDLVERSTAGGDGEAKFQAAWAQRLGERRYWMGAVEPFAFAWSEPECLAWYEEGARVEGGWSRMPPRATLRGRARLGIPGGSEPGPLRLASGVLWKIDGAKVLLWRGEPDCLFGLEDSGALFWRAIMAFGDEERVVGFLETQLQSTGRQLATDLRDLIEELVRRGLLTRSAE